MNATAAPNPTAGPAEAEWRAAVDRVLKGGDFGGLVSRSLDGVPFQPLYAKAVDPPSGPVGEAQPWAITQRVDHPDAGEANRLALVDVAGGADSLTLVWRGAPGSAGYGLDLRTPGDLETVLAGIDLGAVGLRADPGAAGERLAAMLMGLADRRGASLENWRLCLGMDPAGTLATTGRSGANWLETGARMAAVLGALVERGFRGFAFAADGRPYHASGGSEAQELGAVVATGVAALRALEPHGVAPERTRRTLEFTLAADADVGLTVAKLRALRLLWQQVETASGLQPRPLRLHAETAWRMLTRRDPHGNLLRTALACFGAAVGGADSIGVLPFTSALGLPDEDARRHARNTHHVLAAEANLWRVADPAAGSGAFEAWTLDLAGRAWAEFQLIEREGGIAASLLAGAPQARIANTRALRSERIAAGQAPIVGVTVFPNPHETPVPVLRVPAWPGPAPDEGGNREAVAPPLPVTHDAEAFETESQAGGRSP